MKIGIDGNEANKKIKVGVNQYAFEILWGLYKQSLTTRMSGKLQDTKRTANTYTVYLKNPPTSDLPRPNTHWKYKIIAGSGLWVLKNLMPTLLTTEKLDVFFTPGHYLPLASRSPKIITIHDLGYLKFSGQFKKNDFWQLKYWTAISVIISKYIICPSNSTKKDIVRHYPFARNKVKVVHHGYTSKIFNTKIPQKFVRQTLNKYRIPKKYILFLSTLKPSKNIERLLEAYDLAKKRNWLANHKLVIAGKKGWLYDTIFEKVTELGLKKDVIFTDYLPEEEKPALIRGAKVFVLPSLWEGFGMDVLNAMACGVPTIASNVASLPEVGADAVFYIDPYNIESIAFAIKKTLSLTPAEYALVVKKGLKQVQKFSWTKAAKETLKVFELAAGN